jgi:hypothetical protein
MTMYSRVQCQRWLFHRIPRLWPIVQATLLLGVLAFVNIDNIERNDDP